MSQKPLGLVEQFRSLSDEQQQQLTEDQLVQFARKNARQQAATAWGNSSREHFLTVDPNSVFVHSAFVPRTVQ